MYRNKKLMERIRELACSNCGAEDGTVCGAHSNEGKGMGIKASDATLMALCFHCHHAYDQGKEMSREERREFAYRARALTAQALIERGILKVS